MSEPRTEAIWRVVREPEDGSWTITDDLRPGFVVADFELSHAVGELLDVKDLWDATAGRVGVEYRRAEAASPAALDVERLTEAMDFDRVEALAIIEKHGFVFATDLTKPIEERTEAERWEALAFTFYTMLLPSNRRSERIAAEYARLTEQEERGKGGGGA